MGFCYDVSAVSVASTALLTLSLVLYIVAYSTSRWASAVDEKAAKGLQLGVWSSCFTNMTVNEDNSTTASQVCESTNIVIVDGTYSN